MHQDLAGIDGWKEVPSEIWDQQERRGDEGKRYGEK